jgi:nucleotidyltransferase-like protein
MQLDRPFQVVTPTVDGDVLAALARVDAAFTGRGVHQLIDRYSVEGVRRALERLVSQGIVQVVAAGPSKLYSLNRDHLAAPYIVGLSGLQDELLSRLSQRFESWPLRPAYAALFGSAAAHSMRVGSDIDVFVVRPDTVEATDDRWLGQLRQLERDGSRWTGNDLRVLEMSESDAKLGVAAGEQVLADIRLGGIPLAGSARYLRRWAANS